LKKKTLSEKREGRKPQVDTQVEEGPLPKNNQANAPIMEKSNENKRKRITCYVCHEKGHISTSSTLGTSLKSLIIDDVYSLWKDGVGTFFAKYVGAQSRAKKHLGNKA
jgi:hypothetical protein